MEDHNAAISLEKNDNKYKSLMTQLNKLKGLEISATTKKD